MYNWCVLSVWRQTPLSYPDSLNSHIKLMTQPLDPIGVQELHYALKWEGRSPRPTQAKCWV